MERVKRFFVKSVSYGTAENPNFAGAIHTYIEGKSGRMISSEHTDDSAYSNQDFSYYLAREYGYKRACDARRSYAYKHPQNDKYWRTEVKIIEIEV